MSSSARSMRLLTRQLWRPSPTRQPPSNKPIAAASLLMTQRPYTSTSPAQPSPTLSTLQQPRQASRFTGLSTTSTRSTLSAHPQRTLIRASSTAPPDPDARLAVQEARVTDLQTESKKAWQQLYQLSTAVQRVEQDLQRAHVSRTQDVKIMQQNIASLSARVEELVLRMRNQKEVEEIREGTEKLQSWGVVLVYVIGVVLGFAVSTPILHALGH